MAKYKEMYTNKPKAEITWTNCVICGRAEKFAMFLPNMVYVCKMNCFKKGSSNGSKDN